MPQLTAQRPQAVTLDRICDALDSANRNYVVDVCNSRRTVMIPSAAATSYADLVAGVLRVRSVWRGVVSMEQKAQLLPYISHHNRESVGPRVISFDHGDHFHLCTQTSVQVSAGMGSQQLEAQLLLALIMLERFTQTLEEDFTWAPPPNKYFFHQDLLQKQHVLKTSSQVSDNSITQPIDSTVVAKACARLGLNVTRDHTLFRLETPKHEIVLRLFGEDMWFSVSTLARLSRHVEWESLFGAVNDSNSQNALGATSIMGLRNQPYLRFDHLVSVGEGLSERQLDTQIQVGIEVIADLFTRFSVNNPTFQLC